MKGTTNCVYETPCGWCSKWDKECDKKIHKPIESVNTAVVKKCESESDHEWECTLISTDGIYYRCKKCGANKIVPSWIDQAPIVKLNAVNTLSNIPNCCKTCLQHPSNGGSGICNCTAPYFEQGVTITLD